MYSYGKQWEILVTNSNQNNFISIVIFCHISTGLDSFTIHGNWNSFLHYLPLFFTPTTNITSVSILVCNRYPMFFHHTCFNMSILHFASHRKHHQRNTSILLLIDALYSFLFLLFLMFFTPVEFSYTSYTKTVGQLKTRNFNTWNHRRSREE